MSVIAEFMRTSPWIEAALKYAGDTHTLDDVLGSVLAGRLQFWPGRRSVVLTEIEVYPRMKTCHFFLAGGDMGELSEMTPKIEDWAKQLGCTRVTLAGRKGWERTFLKEDGYTPRWYVMAKEL